MLLDIGAGNTDIGVFEGSSFVYTNSIPVGGDNITNDIAVVLNISEEEADKLKRQYGLALKSFIDNDNDIILNTSKDDNTTTPVEKEDKIYEGSAVCEPDEDEEFDAYKLTLEVVISADNKVKNIQNIKWSDRYMSAWYNMAQKTMVPKLISYGFEIPEKYDTVSGATCSSNALVKAYKDAISKINK